MNFNSVDKQESLCDTCNNQNTKWCDGCEYRMPGLNQFDFYQEKKEIKLQTEGEKVRWKD